ncbi:MAG: SRPBCC family protein [Haloarculaceae archaeon]
MQSVTMSRHVDAPPDAVREAMADVEAFMLGAGFTEATVDGDRLHLENHVGLATVELDLRLLDTDDAFAYEQADGMFESMTTTYTVEPDDGGSLVTARTEFELDLAVVGAVLDATVIERQRRRELRQQFDWLAERVGGE